MMHWEGGEGEGHSQSHGTRAGFACRIEEKEKKN